MLIVDSSSLFVASGLLCGVWCFGVCCSLHYLVECFFVLIVVIWLLVDDCCMLIVDCGVLVVG